MSGQIELAIIDTLCGCESTHPAKDSPARDNNAGCDNSIDLEKQMPVLVDEKINEETLNLDENGKSFFDITGLYKKMMRPVIIISFFTIIFTIALSFLPWTNNLEDYDNYDNVNVVTFILCLSVTTFGAIYITYYAYIMKFTNFTKKYIAHITFHIIFWPVFFSLMSYYEVYVWFYYLDFSFFFFGFLPISAHVAYEIVSNRDIKFTIRFAISEFFVIVSALGYTFFLFPIFMKLTDVEKIFWALTLHPLWFEITMLLPQRLIASIDTSEENKYVRYLPALHSIFHNVTIRRMILLCINDMYISLLLITLSNIQEIMFRLSVLWRDGYIMRLLFRGKKPDHTIHGCVILMEMILELVSIFVSPFMMGLFAKYEYMFIFNGAMLSNGTMWSTIIISFFFQLFTEIPTDILCMHFEMRVHNIPLDTLWEKIHTKKVIIFCIYGMCSMGILGMLYTTMLLPRALFCDRYDILTCTYSPA